MKSTFGTNRVPANCKPHPERGKCVPLALPGIGAFELKVLVQFELKVLVQFELNAGGVG